MWIKSFRSPLLRRWVGSGRRSQRKAALSRDGYTRRLRNRARAAPPRIVVARSLYLRVLHAEMMSVIVSRRFRTNDDPACLQVHLWSSMRVSVCKRVDANVCKRAARVSAQRMRGRMSCFLLYVIFTRKGRKHAWVVQMRWHKPRITSHPRRGHDTTPDLYLSNEAPQ